MREMLESRGLAPKKSLGQNFLVDHNLLGKLLEASGAGDGDTVLEVGPGAGVLTRALLERGCRVVACELDAGLAELLRETLGAEFADRFTLIEGDGLPKGSLNPEALRALGDQSWSLVANLPYSMASPLMVHLLTGCPACVSLHVTIQKEVAERVLAGPGEDQYGALGAIAGMAAEGELITLAPPKCFWPPPKVTSAMVSLRKRSEPFSADASAFADFARRVFMTRRKQLGSVFGRELVASAGLDPTRRAEGLGVSEMELLRQQVGTG